MLNLSIRKIILPIIYCTLWFASPLIVAKPLPQHTLEVAPNVYSYGPDHYYSMFIVTSEGVIAIESVNSKHATGMLAAIKQVTEAPVKYLIHSHNHWDHSSGGQVFKNAGATILAHEEAVTWMKANPGKDMAMPDESWSGTRKDLRVGNTTLELHYLGMNHGLGMTVFRLPKQKVAYIADLVTPNRVIFSIMPDFNVREWERSLKEILELDFNKAIFSHNESANPLAGGGKKEVEATLTYLHDLRTAIYAEFKKGTNSMMIPSKIELPQYKDWAMYDEWLAMNAWRVMLDDWMGPFPWQSEK